MSTSENVVLLIITGFESSKLLLSWKTILINRIASVLVESVQLNIMVHVFKAIDLCYMALLNIRLTWSVCLIVIFIQKPWATDHHEIKLMLPDEQANNFRKNIIWPWFFFITPCFVLLLRCRRRISRSRQRTTVQLEGGLSSVLAVFQRSVF